MQHIPRRVRGAVAAAMAATGVACLAAGVVPGGPAAVRWSPSPAVIAAGAAPVVLAARIAAHAIGDASRAPRPAG